MSEPRLDDRSPAGSVSDDRDGAGPAASGVDPAVGDADADLRELIRERFGRVEAVSDRFFEERAADVAAACRDLARRFHRGGRLLAFGRGAAVSDAYHVSVEFVHPVLVGRRALPALCLEGDPVAGLERLGRPVDVALAIASGRPGEELRAALGAARTKGLATVLLAGGTAGDPGVEVDHPFVVPSDDRTVVQEVQETLYHVFWELVHVFFDHPGLLEDGAGPERTAADGEGAG